jgi:hypothetical protein
LKKIIPLVFTSLAVCGFIAVISRNTELLYSFIGHLARENGIDIPELSPSVITWDEACCIRLHI